VYFFGRTWTKQQRVQTMRLRIGTVASHFAQKIGEQLDRSPSQAAEIALAEYGRLHLGVGAASRTDDDQADQIFGRGNLIACHSRGGMKAALAEFAAKERRSLSSAARILLREAMAARGIVPASHTVTVETDGAATAA
jgi:hypothetical protein